MRERTLFLDHLLSIRQHERRLDVIQDRPLVADKVDFKGIAEARTSSGLIPHFNNTNIHFTATTPQFVEEEP